MWSPWHIPLLYTVQHYERKRGQYRHNSKNIGETCLIAVSTKNLLYLVVLIFLCRILPVTFKKRQVKRVMSGAVGGQSHLRFDPSFLN